MATGLRAALAQVFAAAAQDRADLRNKGCAQPRQRSIIGMFWRQARLQRCFSWTVDQLARLAVAGIRAVLCRIFCAELREYCLHVGRCVVVVGVC